MKPLAKPLPLGTIVEPYGKLVQVGWVGERYYWFIDDEGTVAMMPADSIEGAAVSAGESRDA